VNVEEMGWMRQNGAIKRFREEGFLDSGDPEGLVGDLLRIACGGVEDSDAARPYETSDRAYMVKLRDLLDELSIDGDGRWTAQVVLGDLARAKRYASDSTLIQTAESSGEAS
jgi:hypothetical protein